MTTTTSTRLRPRPVRDADVTRQTLPQNTTAQGAARRGGRASLAGPETLPLQDAPVRPWVALALAGVAVVLLAGSRLHASSADLAVTAWFNAHRVGVVGALTTGLYRYLEPPYAAVLAVVIVGVLARRRGLHRALSVALSAAVTYAPVVILKMVFARPRPDTSLLAHPMAMHPGDWSFPSGHTAFVVSMGAALVLASLDGRAVRWAPWAALAATVVMGCSVLTDGVHYPSDVLASLVWCLSLAPLAWALVTRWTAWLLPQAGVPRR